MSRSLIYAKRANNQMGVIWYHCGQMWKLYYDYDNSCFRCPVCHKVLLVLTKDGIPKGGTNK